MAIGEIGSLNPLCDVYVFFRNPETGDPRVLRLFGATVLEPKVRLDPIGDPLTDVIYRGQSMRITVHQQPLPEHTLAQELAVAVRAGEAHACELADLVLDDRVRQAGRGENCLPTYDQLRERNALLEAQVRQLEQASKTLHADLPAALDGHPVVVEEDEARIDLDDGGDPPNTL